MARRRDAASPATLPNRGRSTLYAHPLPTPEVSNPTSALPRQSSPHIHPPLPAHSLAHSSHDAHSRPTPAHATTALHTPCDNYCPDDPVVHAARLTRKSEYAATAPDRETRQ